MPVMLLPLRNVVTYCLLSTGARLLHEVVRCGIQLSTWNFCCGISQGWDWVRRSLTGAARERTRNRAEDGVRDWRQGYSSHLILIQESEVNTSCSMLTKISLQTPMHLLSLCFLIGEGEKLRWKSSKVKIKAVRSLPGKTDRQNRRSLGKWIWFIVN